VVHRNFGTFLTLAGIIILSYYVPGIKNSEARIKSWPALCSTIVTFFHNDIFNTGEPTKGPP